MAARFLQLAGLVIVAFAFFDGVFGGHVRRELVLLLVGAGVFMAGRALQGRGV